MEFEFDKEIDAILRKARDTEVVASLSAHLGADEISAFAENALPELARVRDTEHLADCTRCRKILSDVIALNSEAEMETASSVVPAKIAETKTPWYRKLFVFPQLAYAMGALVVLFGGFFGYLILQNFTDSKNSEVSYSAKKADSAEKPVLQTSPTVFSSSNAAATNSTTTTNSSAPANAPVPMSAPPVSASNTATQNEPREKKSAAPELNNAPIVAQTPGVPDDKPQNKIEREADRDELSKTKKSNSSVAGAAQGRTVKDEREKNETEDAVRSKDDKEVVTEQKSQSKPSAPQTSTLPINGRNQKSLSGATRSVGGKTFNNVGGIWFDSAYTKQKQKTVNRGTSDYQKLDSGLRSIADQFSGTVLLVWKSKAYRIQ